MKNVKKIIDFVKKIFGQDISIKVEKKSKYDIKKNKNCNISISDSGDNNAKQ